MSCTGVIGAGGRTGQAIVAALAGRGGLVRGLVRSDRSAELARRAGADETVTFDLTADQAWEPALKGLDILVFIAPPFDPHEEAHAARTFTAAAVHGVGHIVYYSVLHSSFPGVPHHQRKMHVETGLRDSDLRWTIIAPGMYQQTLLDAIGQSVEGVVRVPYRVTAPFHLVDLADVAEVVARVADEPGEHRYASYELAGPQRLTTAEMIKQVAAATGQSLSAEEVPLTSLRLPPTLSRTAMAERMAMFAKYDRDGYPGNATVLRLLLGRAPNTLLATTTRELSTT